MLYQHDVNIIVMWHFFNVGVTVDYLNTFMLFKWNVKLTLEGSTLCLPQVVLNRLYFECSFFSLFWGMCLDGSVSEMCQHFITWIYRKFEIDTLFCWGAFSQSFGMRRSRIVWGEVNGLAENANVKWKDHLTENKRYNFKKG